MKSQLTAILFALLVPLSACGGDRVTSTSTENTPSSDVIARPAPDEPVVTPEPVVRVPDVEAPVVAPIPTTYAECMAAGKALSAEGEHARARELFEAAARLDQKKSDPHIELARSFIATNERAFAIQAANKAVKLAPGSSQAYNTLGRAELLRHSYENAIAAFQQATELNEGNVWAWNNLGYTHLVLEEFEDARHALVEATSRKGTESYMWNNLGIAYEHLDELDDARLAFENGAELGSAAAAASRKRLEGVTTIYVAKSEPVEDPDVEVTTEDDDSMLEERTFEAREPMPEGAAVDEELDVGIEEPASDEPVEEPTVDEQPKDEPSIL